MVERTRERLQPSSFALIILLQEMHPQRGYSVQTRLQSVAASEGGCLPNGTKFLHFLRTRADTHERNRLPSYQLNMLVFGFDVKSTLSSVWSACGHCTHMHS